MRYLMAAVLILSSLDNFSMDILHARYPWPEVKPDIPTDYQSMFSNPLEMKAVLKKQPKLIVELGSWLGGSTIFMLDAAPQATIIAIDHWKGSPEHQQDYADKLPTLYETFLVNCWKYKDRLIPMRTTTRSGIQEIYNLGLQPDLVYVDAAHEYEEVMADLVTISTLFPQTHIVGDDWGWPSVRNAVVDFAEKNDFTIFAYHNFWDLRPFCKIKKELQKPYVPKKNIERDFFD